MIVGERSFTAEESEALCDALPALGGSKVDLCLKGRAFRRNDPVAIRHYRLRGYQVLKKWLSYWERSELGRALRPEDVQCFTDG